MKKIIIGLISIFFVSLTFSQTKVKEIDIYYFKDLDRNEEDFVKNLWVELDKQSKKFKFQMNLFCLYDQSKSISITSEKSVGYRNKKIENQVLFDKTEVEIELDSLSKSKDYSATVTFDNHFDITLEDGIFHTEKEIKKLYKQIRKKNRNNSVLLLINNGFEKCRFCKENLTALVEELSISGNLDQLVPFISIPRKNGETLRPRGTPSRYQIEFKTQLDLFDLYEVEIVSSSFREPLLKTNVQISTKDDSFENIQLVKAPNGTYRLKIRDEYLGLECLKKENQISTDEVDKDCDCMYDCLYRKVFKIRIRGVDNSIVSSDLWSDEIDVFFQCSK